MNPLVAQAIAQGHGPKVTDPGALHRIAIIMRGARLPDVPAATAPAKAVA